MDEDNTLESIMSAYGLSANDYSINTLDSGVSILNSGSVPNYVNLTRGEYPGSQAMEFYAKDGSISRQQYRNTKGQFGRTLSSATLKRDLRQVLVACFLENFDAKIQSETGQLRKSVEQGTLEDDNDQMVGFRFKIADMPGMNRSWDGTGSKQRPSTSYYGPIVFLGRGAIISPQVNMRFAYKSLSYRTHAVRAAAPRNIFELNEGQIDRINNIILKPITDDAKAWIKQMMDGTKDD